LYDVVVEPIGSLKTTAKPSWMLEKIGKQCCKLTNLADVEETAITDIESYNDH
jgi:hypothetical protein